MIHFFVMLKEYLCVYRDSCDLAKYQLYCLKCDNSMCVCVYEPWVVCMYACPWKNKCKLGYKKECDITLIE